MRIAFVALCAVLAAQAQPLFQSLSPNSDGSLLYFSSALRMKGTEQFPHPKVFVWREGRGVQLYAQEASTASYYGLGMYLSSTAYNLVAVSASSDGGAVALTGLTDCAITGSRCNSGLERYGLQVRQPSAEPTRRLGRGFLSPNGRFLVAGAAVVSSIAPWSVSVVNLSTGQEEQLKSLYWPRSFQHALADDGSLLVSRDGSLALRSGRTGQEQPLPPVGSGDLRVNASGTRVFFVRRGTGTAPALTVLDGATGASRDLADVSSSTSLRFDISDDGTVAAYWHAGRLWTVRADDGRQVAVATLEGNVDELALSGDGTRLFAVVDQRRIVRYDLRTSVQEDVVPAVPQAENVRPVLQYLAVLAKGSVYSVAVTGLPTFSAVRVNGQRVALFEGGPGEVRFQVPWDVPETVTWLELELDTADSGPFQPVYRWPAPFAVRTYASEWFRNGPSISALHEDFSGLVTAESPARPGEVIHAYGRGFGPVMPQPDIGALASASPLAVTREPVVCVLGLDAASARPVEVLFAGLAPGWVGLYQIDLRIPASFTPGESAVYVNCRASEREAGATGSLLVAAAR